MAFQALLYEARDAVARITINRPEKRNTLSPEVVAELHQALADADGDPAVRVLVLTGAGDKAFSAGGDLGGGEIPTPLERYERGRKFAGLFTRMNDLSKPIIARVNGHALAGGLGLMLGCDLAIARDDAEFGTPEIDRGLFPMMIMATIFRNVGRKKGLELLLTGDRVKAAEAERIGLINHAVPASELDDRVDALAAKLAGKSQAILRLGRRAFYTMSEMPFGQSLEYLNTMLTINGLTEDVIEGIMAFMQKRTPEWKDK